jgi:hypothetical protein
MDDLSRMLAETMNDAAGDAPSDVGLLGAVQRRSARRRRRRITATLSAAAAVLAIGVPVTVVASSRPEPVAPPLSIPVSGTRLVAGYTTPPFPYTLPATEGMKAPVASMSGGSLIAFFEAAEDRHHSDITITVSGREPAAGGGAEVQVRGHAGRLRTVDVQPAKQLTLTWQESATRWIQLATDDTYSSAQVVALADSLRAGSVPVLPPFRLDLAPAGLAATTVTASRIGFGTPGPDGLAVVLRKRQQLTGADRKVGDYRAALTHQAGGSILKIDVTDWDATLEVTAGAGLALTDADLVRLGAGIHVLNRSDPE